MDDPTLKNAKGEIARTIDWDIFALRKIINDERTEKNGRYEEEWKERERRFKNLHAFNG